MFVIQNKPSLYKNFAHALIIISKTITRVFDWTESQIFNRNVDGLSQTEVHEAKKEDFHSDENRLGY